MKTTFIYELIDPRTNETRYIGKSNKPKDRYSQHLTEKYNSYKCNWVKQLRYLNLKPILNIIDEVPFIEWEFWEKFYISLYKTWEVNLTKLSKGGTGGIEHITTEETKQKISKTLMGHLQPKEVVDKAIQSRKQSSKERGYYHSEESKDKTRQTLIGHEVTKETREVMSLKAYEGFKNGTRKISEKQLVRMKQQTGSLNPASRKVVQYDLEGNLVKVYETCKEASVAVIGKEESNISSICKGGGYTVYGFIWRYFEPKENELQNTIESVKETIERFHQAKVLQKKAMSERQKLRW
jgi:hypothetical protein